MIEVAGKGERQQYDTNDESRSQEGVGGYFYCRS